MSVYRIKVNEQPQTEIVFFANVFDLIIEFCHTCLVVHKTDSSIKFCYSLLKLRAFESLWLKFPKGFSLYSSPGIAHLNQLIHLITAVIKN